MKFTVSSVDIHGDSGKYLISSTNKVPREPVRENKRSSRSISWPLFRVRVTLIPLTITTGLV